MGLKDFFKKCLAAAAIAILFGAFAAGSFTVTARVTGLWEEARAYLSEKENAGNDGADIRRTVTGEDVYADKASAGTERTSGADGGETPDANAAAAGGTSYGAAAAERITVVTDVSAVVKEVMPAVVAITNQYTATANFWGQTYRQQAEASGSGIIVGENDTELLLVTNYHVVEDAEKLLVVFVDESVAEAQMKGTDPAMDLAVLSIPMKELSASTKSGIAVATLGNSDALTVGEPAIAIGNALGYGQSVTTGVISALNRQLSVLDEDNADGETRAFIQTDAAINPGNSGGALLNIRGEVIGINSNKLGGEAVEGMGYAIPISAAEPIISELMLRETRARVSDAEKGFIGITGSDVSAEAMRMYGFPAGVYVTGVVENSGAAFAGLREGDILVSFDGNKISSMEELQKLLQYYPVGSVVKVAYMRAEAGVYTERTVNLTLGRRSRD